MHLFNIAESDPAKKKTLTAPKDGFLQLDFLNGNPVRFRALFGDEPKRKKRRKKKRGRWTPGTDTFSSESVLPRTPKRPSRSALAHDWSLRMRSISTV